MQSGTQDAKGLGLEALLEQSVEEGLRSILGQSGVQMVLSHCPLNRLSADPVTCHEALKSIFMENGAAILEREIARRLLDNMGGAQTGEGPSHRFWLATTASSPNGSGQASEKEKKILRQFLAFASLPQGHSVEAKLETTSLELTALSFANAFKKGI